MVVELCQRACLTGVSQADGSEEPFVTVLNNWSYINFRKPCKIPELKKSCPGYIAAAPLQLCGFLVIAGLS